jgi:hypothetical protein
MTAFCAIDELSARGESARLEGRVAGGFTSTEVWRPRRGPLRRATDFICPPARLSRTEVHSVKFFKMNRSCWVIGGSAIVFGSKQ